MKAKLSPMIGVAEKAVQLLNQTSYGIRYVVIRFNKERSAMMPVMQGASSNDWELDFTAFTNAMAWTDGTDPSPCVGFYMFPYWTGDKTQEHQPLVVTYSPGAVPAKETARYGYFLGSLLLATDQDKVMDSYDYVALSETASGSLPTYQEFCESALKLEHGACELDETFHNCPWDEGAAGSPCADSACMGATFEPPNLSASGTIPTACCDYVIDDFCKQPDNMGTHGCHPALLRTFGDLCAEKRPDEVPVMTTSLLVLNLFSASICCLRFCIEGGLKCAIHLNPVAVVAHASATSSVSFDCVIECEIGRASCRERV